MTRDRVLSSIANVIVWGENLILEIKAARFVSTSKQLAGKAKPLAVDYVETVVVNEEGTVLHRYKELKAH